MNRRRFLAAAVVGAGVSTAGVVRYVRGRSGSDPSLPAPVVDFEFETEDRPEGWYLEEGAGPHPEERPIVDVDDAPEGRELTVRGTMWIGSGDCQDATVERVSYDESDNGIRLVVTWADTDWFGWRKCRDALESEFYRISLTVDDRVRRIRVLERDFEGDNRSTVEQL